MRRPATQSVLLGAVLLAGCLGPLLEPSPGTGDESGTSALTLQVLLALSPRSDPDDPDRELVLTVLARAHANGAPDVQAGITIPQGVELVSGSTEFRGPVPYEGRTLRILVRPTNGTQALFRGWGEEIFSAGRFTDVDLLGISATGDELRPSGHSFTARPGLARSQWPPPPDVRVRLEADASDPYQVTSVIESNQSHPFRAVLWVRGDLPWEWEGNVSPAAPDVREWSIPALPTPSDGEYNYTVTLVVYPHIRVDDGLHEDALVYHVTESSVDVSRKPPRTAPTNTQDTSSYQHTASEIPG